MGKTHETHVSRKALAACKSTKLDALSYRKLRKLRDLGIKRSSPELVFNGRGIRKDEVTCSSPDISIKIYEPEHIDNVFRLVCYIGAYFNLSATAKWNATVPNRNRGVYFASRF